MVKMMMMMMMVMMMTRSRETDVRHRLQGRDAGAYRGSGTAAGGNYWIPPESRCKEQGNWFLADRTERPLWRGVPGMQALWAYPRTFQDRRADYQSRFQFRIWVGSL